MPSTSVLIAARAAHADAGCDPVVVFWRPPAKDLTVASLSDNERKWLVSVHRGGINRISKEGAEALADLGLITIESKTVKRKFTEIRTANEHGLRLAAECHEASVKTAACTEQMFDLGQPDPEAVARLEKRQKAHASPTAKAEAK